MKDKCQRTALFIPHLECERVNSTRFRSAKRAEKSALHHPSAMSSDLEKYRSLYFGEAQEQLAAIHASLDALGDAPTDRNELNAAFRAAHTLKAMSATMGFGELTRASHSLEDLLARMKNHNETPTDLTLRFSDQLIRNMRFN